MDRSLKEWEGLQGSSDDKFCVEGHSDLIFQVLNKIGNKACKEFTSIKFYLYDERLMDNALGLKLSYLLSSRLKHYS
jgi:hypothetical protein